MTSIAVNRASGGTSISLQCLTYRCEAWNNPIHVCNGFEDHVATLETGEVVTFIAADFAFTRPERSTKGNITISTSLDGETKISEAADADTVIQLIDQAKAVNLEIALELREYMLDDLSAPATGTERMLVGNYTFDIISGQLDCPASYYDFVNKTWPPRDRNYNTNDYPGLKYYV